MAPTSGETFDAGDAAGPAATPKDPPARAGARSARPSASAPASTRSPPQVAAAPPAAPAQPDGQSAEDALFGLFAVKDGVCTEAQVEKAHARRQKAGDGKPLCRVLIEMGAITPEARDRVLDALDPQVIPGYRIEGEAGRGGMGVVYRARQLSMDRPVAVKVLSRRLSDDASYVKKFLTEARLAAKLNHENVVAAIDAGEANGLHYFVMEFVAGRSAAELLVADGPMPWERAFELAEQVARALSHAHQVGLVHRDVKPENIMLGADGQAKLCDLGLAKPTAIAGTGGKSDMTEGTPYYCSPEQATGRTDIDARSDVYSLGATLYHLLMGEPPFDGDDARSILVKQVRAPFPDLDAKMPQVPGPLRRLIEGMVVKDREDRLASMRAFEERLVAARRAEAAASAPPSAKRPRREGGPAALALAVGVFVLVAGLGAWAVLGLLPDPASPTGPTTPGEAPPTAPVADPDPSQPTPVAPTPPRPPRVTRVNDPPTPTTTPTTPVGPVAGPVDDAPDAKPAAALLAEARAWEKDHPDDLVGQRDRFKRVVEQYPSTLAAGDARRITLSLEERVRQLGYDRFGQLTDRCVSLVKDGAFNAAITATVAFESEWRAAGIAAVGDQAVALRRTIEDQAKVRLEDALGRVAAGAPGGVDQLAAGRDALAQLAPRLPADLEARARARLDELSREDAQREATTTLGVFLAARDQALRRGDLPAARQVLAGARADERLAPVRARVDDALRDLDLVEKAAQAFDRGVTNLIAQDDRARLRLVGALEPQRGKLSAYDMPSWHATWRPQGARQDVSLDLHEVSEHDLLALALPATEGRANALYFMGRGACAAARVALDALVAAGGKDDPTLRAEIGRVEGVVFEERAQAAIARVLDPAASPDDIIAGVRGLADLRNAPTYRAQVEAVRAAYVRARAAQLVAAPELFFKGAVKKSRRDLLTIHYTWKNPAELEDWRIDAAIPGSSARLEANRGVVVKGKWSHVGVFQGGELGVQLEAQTADGGKPNINVVVGDRGGWTGTLLGLGFSYGALQELRVSGAAPRKPGYTVRLPANVCVVLDGREPRLDGENFAAETEPSVQGQAGRSQKLEATRGPEGELRLRVRGRQVYGLPALADWDKPGGIAIIPLATELLVQDVEIAGRLDDAWVQTRSQALATQEAAALLPPPPP